MNEQQTPAASGQGIPSATPATIGVQNSQATPQPVQNDWTSSFDPDLKGYVQNKGFKDPGMVLDSYRNLEKLMGVPQERLVKLPEKFEDKDGWNQVYAKLGRPEKPEDYKFNVPQDADENFVKWAKGSFHELGLGSKQAEALMEKYQSFSAEAQKQHMESHNAKFNEELNSLKKEWGAAYDKHVELSKSAVKQLGIDAQTIDGLEKAMGTAGVYKFFSKLGEKVMEPEFETGNGGKGPMTPAQATNKLESLKKDETWLRRFAMNELTAAEKDEYQKINEAIAPGFTQLGL